MSEKGCGSEDWKGGNFSGPLEKNGVRRGNKGCSQAGFPGFLFGIREGKGKHSV